VPFRHLAKLVLATSNAGKIAELRAMVEGAGIRVHSLGEFAPVAAVEETGLSFVENAILKARHAARLSGMPALGDDSGLEVDALDGRPGIYSARFAGPDASDADNNRKLLEALAGVPHAERGARFHCVLALLRHPRDPVPLICSASWEGRIRLAPAGSNGFGYDPLFEVPDYGCSAAELPSGLKNRISHRARALGRLLEALGITRHSAAENDGA